MCSEQNVQTQSRNCKYALAFTNYKYALSVKIIKNILFYTDIFLKLLYGNYLVDQLHNDPSHQSSYEDISALVVAFLSSCIVVAGVDPLARRLTESQGAGRRLWPLPLDNSHNSRPSNAILGIFHVGGLACK